MNYWDWILLKVKFALRKLILAFHDTPVHHRVGKYDILLPLSHKFSIDDAASPGRANNLGRIADQVCKTKGDLHFVDIGANVGDTVAVLRNYCIFPILAIEGDGEFYSYLESNMRKFPNVWTFQGLLSDIPREFPGALTTNYGGSKQVTFRSDAQQILRFLTLPEVLDRFPEFRLAGMVKIDTDGFDCKILRGAIEWLREVRPVIFFEYDPHHLSEQRDDGISIFRQLRSVGYEGVLVFEGNGDFMFSLRLQQEELIEELHCYFVGRESKKYADLCMFHKQDGHLFDQCRAMELAHATRARSK